MKIGGTHSAETRRKISEARKRNPVVTRYWLGKKRSPETNAKIGEAHLGKKASLEARKKMSLSKIGDKHPNWKGGITSVNKRLRNSKAFKNWRHLVFMRDNWTCQDCYKTHCELHPHHIKELSRFPELALDVDNGVTLCPVCHRKRHKNVFYGKTKHNKLSTSTENKRSKTR